jgi:Ca2+/Na+ antiporter
MYDIRQFKPVLYVLLLLGFTGFALAGQSPGLWVLSVGALALNAWLIRRGRFKPMPRLLSNLITIVALLYVIRDVFTSTTTPVMVIGQFLVLLQVVKLWEQRANRDYAQLLVLSLLLMVAASINTASLLFGVLLVTYLFLSLYCCLLFHLKVETDTAKAAMAVPEHKVSPAMLRQDQRHLTRSMRRLTGLVSAVAIVFAVAVFLLFPRGTGAGLLGPMQFRPSQTLVGFSNEVGFENIARIQQNNEKVADVKVSRNGRPSGWTGPLLLRGMTLYNYTGGHGVGRWRWSRSKPSEDASEEYVIERNAVQLLPDAPGKAAAASLPTDGDLWTQNIKLHPTGTNVLFAVAGPVSFKPQRNAKISFSPGDNVLESLEPLLDAIEYEVTSRNALGSAPPQRAARSEIDPKVEQYARRPEVSGQDAAGPLAARRHKGLPRVPDALDEQIAANIERHLKTQFSYSLDLTDTKRIAGRDPLVAFLYDFKKGHCEYFAGAMTLMCQSLGLTARMVVGFHCDEYNTMGEYYIVRQSHAHAWVEVLTADGWKTYDPTSGRDASEHAREEGAWQRVRHFFDYLEYNYANSVIAYNNDDRTNLIQTVDTGMSKLAVRSTTGLDFLRRRGLRELRLYPLFWNVSSAVLSAVLGLITVAGLAFIARFAWEKWQLRRRAQRIGITSLPHDEQMRLARQLGFYDDLLQLLGRHQISRPRHLTPLEFSRSLLFLPAGAYETVSRLTELFYKVRFGRAELSTARRRHLSAVIERLESELATKGE